MTILGISGKRESGKSTLAKTLEKYGYKRISLATPLKEMCKEKWDLNDDQVYGCLKESPTQYRRTDGSFYTPRDILIREGCLARSIDNLFWCKKLYKLLHKAKDKYVIDDIRFLNEINYFKNMGAKFIRLERSEISIGKAALDDLSETELDSYKDWDFKLEAKNNIELQDLDKFADYINAHF